VRQLHGQSHETNHV